TDVSVKALSTADCMREWLDGCKSCARKYRQRLTRFWCFFKQKLIRSFTCTVTGLEKVTVVWPAAGVAKAIAVTVAPFGIPIPGGRSRFAALTPRTIVGGQPGLGLLNVIWFPAAGTAWATRVTAG